MVQLKDSNIDEEEKYERILDLKEIESVQQYDCVEDEHGMTKEFTILNDEELVRIEEEFGEISALTVAAKKETTVKLTDTEEFNHLDINGADSKKNESSKNDDVIADWNGKTEIDELEVDRADPITNESFDVDSNTDSIKNKIVEDDDVLVEDQKLNNEFVAVVTLKDGGEVEQEKCDRISDQEAPI